MDKPNYDDLSKMLSSGFYRPWLKEGGVESDWNLISQRGHIRKALDEAFEAGKQSGLLQATEAEANPEAGSGSKPKNTIIAIGRRKSFNCYLNISRDEAIERYLKEHINYSRDEIEGYLDIDEIHFGDVFSFDYGIIRESESNEQQ